MNSVARLNDLADAMRAHAAEGLSLLPPDVRAIVAELRAISTAIHRSGMRKPAASHSRSKAASAEKVAA